MQACFKERYAARYYLQGCPPGVHSSCRKCLGAAVVLTRATLYEKLGGRDAVIAAVDKFYVKVGCCSRATCCLANQDPALLTSSWYGMGALHIG